MTSSRVTFLISLASGLFLTLFSPGLVVAQTTNQATTLSGYAWSSNVGWIQVGPGNGYGLRLLPTSNNRRYLSGYAWSSAIGWLSFSQPDSSNFPSVSSDTSQDHWGARANLSGSSPYPITGWARACGVFESGCSAETTSSGTSLLKSDSQRGGWDGWIKFGGNISPGAGNYGVNYDTATPGNYRLTGYAWGGEVLGWISFCDTSASNFHCVHVNDIVVTCSATPNPATTSGNVNWQAQILSGGDGNPADDVYCWGTQCTPSLGGAINSALSTYTQVLPVAGSYVANMKVTNANGTGYATCLLQVNDTNSDLAVSFTGSGSGRVTGDATPAVDSINCLSGNANPNDCTGTYSSANPITLTATPSSGNFIAWHGVTCNGGQTSPVCTFPVSLGTDYRAVAEISVPGSAAPAASISVTPPIISVDRHDPGLVSYSSSAKISNLTDLTLDICLKDLTSKVVASPPNVLTDPLLAPNTRCVVNNQLVDCNRSDLIVATLAPRNSLVSVLGSDSATLRLALSDRLEVVRAASPYNLTLGVCGGNPADDVSIEFRYQPAGVDPR